MSYEGQESNGASWAYIERCLPYLHGIRLHSASHEYHGYLHKKKEYTSVEEGVKMLPIDALGAVMMAHGEEFGHDSAFGKLDRRCSILMHSFIAAFI